MAREVRLIFLIINVIFGLYFLNVAIGFLSMPDYITNLDPWIFGIGGVLIILGGINYMRTLTFVKRV